MTTSTATVPGTAPTGPAKGPPPVVDHLRFLRKHEHLSPTFGNDGFARKAEAFARVFGTPKFLAAQTAFVVVWIVINLTGVAKFDAYPFILLNLAFSLQAAYAAPLILLAQTRQAERDKALADADAQHREDLARATEQRQAIATQNTAQLIELLEQNTRLTEMTKKLSERIETLTVEMHHRMHYVPALARAQQQADQPGIQQSGGPGSSYGGSGEGGPRQG
ncbi:DUF1003 domain-containing protein [Acidovorax sp. LjRoot66]|uniref:DUF1003 domain-containing protein n=1 Tax=Acidovorax sp. LjRoot66 TaxID=3342334 RepID=UPI003ECF5DD1